MRATACSSLRSSARYTSPMPPRPRRPTMRYRSATRSPGANRPGPDVEMRAAPLDDEDGVFRGVPARSGEGDDGATPVGFSEESSLDFIARQLRYRRSEAACHQATDGEAIKTSRAARSPSGCRNPTRATASAERQSHRARVAFRTFVFLLSGKTKCGSENGHRKRENPRGRKGVVAGPSTRPNANGSPDRAWLHPTHSSRDRGRRLHAILGGTAHCDRPRAS